MQDSEFEMDNDVRKALTGAIAALSPKLDAEFYELGSGDAEEEQSSAPVEEKEGAEEQA